MVLLQMRSRSMNVSPECISASKILYASAAVFMFRWIYLSVHYINRPCFKLCMYKDTYPRSQSVIIQLFIAPEHHIRRDKPRL
jgi:hypothetical protein